MVRINGEMLYTATEVAGMLRVHPDTIRNWSNRGLLSPQRLGRRGDRHYSLTGLQSFIQQASA